MIHFVFSIKQIFSPSLYQNKVIYFMALFITIFLSPIFCPKKNLCPTVKTYHRYIFLFLISIKVTRINTRELHILMLILYISLPIDNIFHLLAPLFMYNE